MTIRHTLKRTAKTMERSGMSIGGTQNNTIVLINTFMMEMVSQTLLFLIKEDAHMTAVYAVCTRQIPFLRILILLTVVIYAVQYVLPMQPLQDICMNPQLNKSMK
jgi:hypothetical protein